MGFSGLLKAVLLELLALLLIYNRAFSKSLDQPALPHNFLFGTASSSYQFEGAYLADGKGLSNWDVFTHKSDGISDRSNGDVAVDQYHRYLEDIDLMEAINVNSYRFSISWARVLPKGRFGEVNFAGINYYNKLIDALLLKGMEPFVTLTHYDHPQELENRYGSWLSNESRIDFAYFADTCFKYFGDRVKYWATFNEPNVQITNSYYTGQRPPCHCSGSFDNCKRVDPEELFAAAHNIVLAHADAVDIYRTKYQTEQGGKIGMVLNAAWYEPFSDSKEDVLAAERALAFIIDWFLDPIIFGKYPPEMENLVGDILPTFSSNDQEKLKKSLDFIGINHYASYYVKDCIISKCTPGPWTSKIQGSYELGLEKNGTPLGEPTTLVWLNVYPPGMTKIVNYLKDRYNNTPMFITENGFGEAAEPSEELNFYDYKRINYMKGHLDAVLATIRNGADVRGYFAWSLLDNFEWNDGYTVKFGLCHVNLTTQKRTPRLSATWYKNFIERTLQNSKKGKLQQMNMENNTSLEIVMPEPNQLQFQ